jgi:hypothetical protein
MATFKGYTFYATPYSHVRGRFKILGRCGLLGTAVTRTHGIGSRVQSGDFTNASPTVLNVSPTTGLKVGQKLQTSATVPANTTITNIAGTTLTLSQSATATSPGFAFYTYDRIEVQGAIYDFPSLEELAENIAVDDVGLVMRTDAYLRQSLTGGQVINVAADDNVTLLFEDVYYAAFGVGSLAYRATNGQNYSDELDTLSGTAYSYPFQYNGSRYTVSKYDQPEHVPEESEGVVGGGTLQRFVATKDTLFAFTSDGLYAIEGDAGVFRTRKVDETLRLATRSSVDVMLDEVWAYTNRGLVIIGPAGVRREVSAPLIGTLIPGAAITDESTDETTTQLTTFLTCDEHNREVRLCIRSGGTSTIYLYNALTDRFSTIVDSAAGTEVVAEVYAPYLQSIVWAPTSAGANTPLYTYHATTKRSEYDVLFQPITGDKSAFTLKQWADYDLLFTEVGDSSLTIIPSVNDVTLGTAVTSTVQNGDRRFVGGFPLDAGMAHTTQIGFLPGVDTGAGWFLAGLSVRWTPLPMGDQVQK